MKILQFRPICINKGCNHNVGVRTGRIDDENPKWGIHCWHCQSASYGKRPHRKGVIPFKTGRCSNRDGHLKFGCAINYKKSPWAIGMTEVDHKNGNSIDSRIRNLDELCPMCHKRKSHLKGDHDGWKNYRAAA